MKKKGGSLSGFPPISSACSLRSQLKLRSYVRRGESYARARLREREGKKRGNAMIRSEKAREVRYRVTCGCHDMNVLVGVALNGCGRSIIPQRSLFIAHEMRSVVNRVLKNVGVCGQSGVKGREIELSFDVSTREQPQVSPEEIYFTGLVERSELL